MEITSTGAQFLAVVIAMTVIAMVIVSARLSVRQFMVHNAGLDDLLILLAMVSLEFAALNNTGSDVRVQISVILMASMMLGGRFSPVSIDRCC